MWNGMFAPMQKHRDYQHENFVEHEKDNGGSIRVATEPTPVIANPVTGEMLDEVSPYYEATFTLHDGKEYIYLIESDTPGPPSEEEIEDQILEHLKNRVSGGRDIRDYLDLEVEGINTDEVGLADRYEGRFTVSQLLDAIAA